MFVYRALMEFSQFGDTEIPADKLSAVYTKLGGTDPGRPRCRLEDEFRVGPPPAAATAVSGLWRAGPW